MEKLKKQLSILINLAKSDGDFHEHEWEVIRHLAEVNDFSEKELEALVENPLEVGDLRHLSNDDKFDYLYQVIRIMKADQVILNSELEFCNKIAHALGFQVEALMDIFPHVHLDKRDEEVLSTMKKRIERYLIK